ncbi:MAG: tripartite tricarboxylate transporter TctB family protein [Alphaproteobacteria bacterium]|nr:tripartite tricarboxylate transporter TctB family protein [Alphaproteobacteria bacterium]
MALDKWIAVVFLAIALVYGYASYTYPLLPFERNMVFLPSTMPMVLSGLGILFSLIIILTSRKTADADGDALGDFDIPRLRDHKTGQALGLIAAMVVYALALRPIGFVVATTLFLFGTGWILGERKLHIMILSALVGAGCIWYLVQETLGIFLRPLPWFMS